MKPLSRQSGLPPKAVIYARFSSHNQREESIEQQVAECRAYAAANDLDVIRIYHDSAKTGKNDNRTQYQRLQRDAKKGEFEFIIAYKSNRIARNMLLALSFEGEMEKLGIRVVYAKEEFGDTAAGRFALRTMMNVNQFYSENMAEDIRRGLRDNAESCKVTGALPYGYQSGENGKPVICEAQAEIVREIFKRVSGGEAFVHIANDLNMRGIKTQKGGFWNKNSFHSILNNERYTGVYIYTDIRIEGGMPQIVEKELFLKVSNRIHNKNNPQGRHRENGDYLLTGKLRCGHCGTFMMGTSGTGKNGKLHYYYACQNARKKEKECDKKTVRRDYIEHEIAAAIKEYVLQGTVIDWIADCVEQYQKANREASELDMLKSQLADTQKSIKNIMTAIENGIFTDTTKSRLLELEQAQKELTNNILIMEAASAPVPRDRVVTWLESFRGGDVDDPSYRKTLFNSFLSTAYLYDDGRCKIVFDIGGKGKELDFSVLSEEDADLSGCSYKLPSNPPEESQANPFTLFMVSGSFVLTFFLKHD